MIYTITITRIMLGFIFLYSFITKLRDLAAFERTIQNFQILPDNLQRPAATGFMLAEFLIVVTVMLNGTWLYLSYGISIVILVIFIYALNSVLQRNIQTSCNCFGATEKKVSPYDIWRNMGIILVAVIGLIGYIFNDYSVSLSTLECLFSAMVALAISILLINMRDILELVS